MKTKTPATMTQYILIWRTATHVDWSAFDDEKSAREDDHFGECWAGRLFRIDHPNGFGVSEAKVLYRSGEESLSPAWGVKRLD